MNLPQYVLIVTNLLEYKINIVAKRLDILCFTSILCIFVNSRCLTSKGHFSWNKLIAKVCFDWGDPSIWFHVPSGGYPGLCSQVPSGGYQSLWSHVPSRGYPKTGRGYPTLIGKQEDSTCCGRYAACVYKGRLSCYVLKHRCPSQKGN